MDKKVFNRLTREIFGDYGFIKDKNKYILSLKDVTIIVMFCSWRGVKSFNYYFYINALYSDIIPFEERFDTLIDIKMEHTPTLRGYHAHEIIFEKYDEEEYKDLLNNMLHRYFDPYKVNALQFLRDNDYCMVLSKKAREYLGII